MTDSLRARIEAIQQEALATIPTLKNLQEFQDCKSHLLGRKGTLTEALKSLGGLSPQERPALGKFINEVKQTIETRLAEVENRLARKEQAEKLKAGAMDITLPGLKFFRGHRHPIQQVLAEIETIFAQIGFAIYEGPDVETDYYNFEALNFPKEHPARDMQDTFYISTKNLLLRTHTSPVQIRVMEKTKPPLYMIAPGTVYRHDDDVTHSPMFHQVEGLMVDAHITFGDLKGVLSQFCQAMFGRKRDVRFRPSFFPFVEPGAEVDIACELCKGRGCRVCGGDGWMEILGAGMVHPAVLEQVKIDPKKYSGFAFGMGVERIAMLKFGIDDIRLFYESDMRFLEQF